MSILSKRLEKLEHGQADGVIVFIVDQFTATDDEPVIRAAHTNGRAIEPQPDETQSDFVKRVNPRNRPAAMLEADCEML